MGVRASDVDLMRVSPLIAGGDIHPASAVQLLVQLAESQFLGSAQTEHGEEEV